MTGSETPYRLEPLRVENAPEEITDLVAEVFASAATLGNWLHPKTASSLSHLIRIMNTYYSNLIEGHHTRPKEIEQALAGQVEDSPKRRNLQLEALAHLKVQEQIDQSALADNLPPPFTIEFIKWIHKEFYKEMPIEFRTLRFKDKTIQFEPGKWRYAPEHDVAVGRHIPPSSESVVEFMNYLCSQYAAELNKGRTAMIVAFAASHHRFNYIHPFPDGNGRVSRLLSHAVAHKIGIGAHGLWSLSRGLARGLKSRSDYKSFMDLADSPRKNDLDGRGNLSRSALIDFVTWFLKVTLDQLTFMTSLFEMNSLSFRLKRLVDADENLKPESYSLLQQALVRGQFERGEAPAITGKPERTARRILDNLEKKNLLKSETPKGAVSLHFPVDSVEILFPNLFTNS